MGEEEILKQLKENQRIINERFNTLQEILSEPFMSS
jgi:hypothetical protein